MKRSCTAKRPGRARIIVLAWVVAALSACTAVPTRKTSGPPDRPSSPANALITGQPQAAARGNAGSTGSPGLVDSQFQTLIEEQGIPIGSTPEEVEKAWGQPDATQIEASDDGDIEIWYYTQRRPAVHYQVTKATDPETGETVYHEEPQTVYRDYVLRRATFKEGKLDAWRIYPEGFARAR